MSSLKILESPVVKFYGSGVLHTPTKKLITDNYSDAFNEGREAWLKGCGSNENPYNKEDGNAIWSKYDCWLEGYLSGTRY